MKFSKYLLVALLTLSATTQNGTYINQLNVYAEAIHAYLTKAVNPVTGEPIYKECIQNLSLSDLVCFRDFVQSQIITLSQALEETEQKQSESLKVALISGFCALGCAGICTAMFTWKPNLSTKKKTRFINEHYMYNAYKGVWLGTTIKKRIKKSPMEDYIDAATAVGFFAGMLGISSLIESGFALNEKLTIDTLRNKIEQLRMLKGIIEKKVLYKNYLFI